MSKLCHKIDQMNFDKQKKMQLHQILKKQQMKIKTHQNIIESKNPNNNIP